MITFFSKIFIGDEEKIPTVELRRKKGILFGAVGIGLNILLFIIKIIAGVMSKSVAIIADSLNNLSDGGSSLVSLVGFKLSGHKPDPDHPFGHGRIEYVSGLIISMLIILMGFELFMSSVKEIIHPGKTILTPVSFGVLFISIAVKIYMYLYNKEGSVKYKSSVMAATALDSLSDTVSTSVVLICMIISKYSNLNLDGIAGIFVACFIIYTGIKSAKDTIDPLLGQKPDKEFVDKIAKFVMSYDGIHGVHDLVVHDYGAGRMMITLHAEVSAEDNIVELHDTIDNIEKKLREVLGCHATIHMDPIMVNDENSIRMRRLTELIVKSIDESLTIHDFRMVYGQTHINLIFDCVVPYEMKMTEEEVKKAICDKVSSLPGNLFAVVEIDRPMV